MEGVELEGGGGSSRRRTIQAAACRLVGPQIGVMRRDAAEGFRPYLVKDFSGKFGLYGPIHKAICKNGDFLL